MGNLALYHGVHDVKPFFDGHTELVERSLYMPKGKVCCTQVHEFETRVKILSNVLKFNYCNVVPSSKGVSLVTDPSNEIM